VCLILVTQVFLSDDSARTLANVAYEKSIKEGRPAILPLSFGASVPMPLATLPSVEIDNLPEMMRNSIVLESVQRILNKTQVRTKERLEVQAKVQEKLDEYISPVLRDLEKRDRFYRRTAYVCYSFALFALSIGLVYACVKAIQTPPPVTTWEPIVQHVIASIIVIALLGAVTRLAFLLGKSFMVESLRNGDRIHAISFGQFYLRAFGDKVEWTEVKEAFQHWNIDKGSSFIGQNAADVDPQILQTIRVIGKSLISKSKVSKVSDEE
jgi:hypothetical protein